MLAAHSRTVTPVFAPSIWTIFDDVSRSSSTIYLIIWINDTGKPGWMYQDFQTNAVWHIDYDYCTSRLRVLPTLLNLRPCNMQKKVVTWIQTNHVAYFSMESGRTAAKYTFERNCMEEGHDAHFLTKSHVAEKLLSGCSSILRPCCSREWSLWKYGHVADCPKKSADLVPCRPLLRDAHMAMLPRSFHFGCLTETLGDVAHDGKFHVKQLCCSHPIESAGAEKL